VSDAGILMFGGYLWHLGGGLFSPQITLTSPLVASSRSPRNLHRQPKKGNDINNKKSNALNHQVSKTKML